MEGYIHNGNYVGDKGPYFGTRHVQIILLAFCLLIGFCMRASLSVQIVAMTSRNSPNPDIPVYDWDNTSIILSSFFWAYVISNIFAAPLERRYGPKWFLFGAILLNTVAFVLIPFSAERFGSMGVIVCRIFQGAGQGFMFPTQQVLLGLWAPTEERARAGVAVTSGITLGAILATGLTGYLSTTWWGWPSTFYLFGAMGFLWCLFYWIYGHHSPATHPRITVEEKNYIEVSLNQHQKNEIAIPWKSIITSIPVWANLIAQIGFAWAVNMSLTEYSTYLDKVMNFNIKSNGLYSAIPALMALLAGLLFGPVSDYIISERYISATKSRKVFHMFGGTAISGSLIYLSYLDETQKILSVVLMVIVSIGQSAVICGNGVNPVDLSPKFAGVIYGLSNSVSQAIALFAPIMVQYVVTDQTDVAQWRIVFLTTAGSMFGTSIFFLIFASGERQLWDGLEETYQKRKVSTFSIAGSIGVPGV